MTHITLDGSCETLAATAGDDELARLLEGRPGRVQFRFRFEGTQLERR